MNEVDFIDEILIPCHGIRECRVGHAVSEEIYIMIEHHEMVQTAAIVQAKLTGTVSRITYYFLAFFKHVKWLSSTTGS